MSGKWHVTPPPQVGTRDNWPRRRGFDHFFGLISSVRSYFDPPTLTREDEPIEAPPGFYLTEAISDDAVASSARSTGRTIAPSSSTWPTRRRTGRCRRSPRTSPGKKGRTTAAGTRSGSIAIDE